MDSSRAVRLDCCRAVRWVFLRAAGLDFFEGWVGFGTGWAGLIGHQLGLVGPLKTHGLRAKFWARL